MDFLRRVIYKVATKRDFSRATRRDEDKTCADRLTRVEDGTYPRITLVFIILRHIKAITQGNRYKPRIHLHIYNEG